MRISEAFGRDIRFKIDNLTVIEKLDLTGLIHCPMIGGMKVGRMEYTFKGTDTGTLFENSLVAGPSSPALSAVRQGRGSSS